MSAQGVFTLLQGQSKSNSVVVYCCAHDFHHSMHAQHLCEAKKAFADVQNGHMREYDWYTQCQPTCWKRSAHAAHMLIPSQDQSMLVQ